MTYDRGALSDYLGKPVIGRDIPWALVEAKEVFRVVKFTPVANVVGKNKIEKLDPNLPYALLLLDNPQLDQQVAANVTHRKDFLTLWDIYERQGVRPDQEVIVAFDHYKGFLSFLLRQFLPYLWVQVRPRGELEYMHGGQRSPELEAYWSSVVANFNARMQREYDSGDPVRRRDAERLVSALKRAAAEGKRRREEQGESDPDQSDPGRPPQP